MAIQWFPGHMHATRKAMEERIKTVHVVIEMLDARLPGSSSNPLLAQLALGKPALKILNKQDLADPQRTADWLAHFNAQFGTHAYGLDASMKTPVRQLEEACRALAPTRGGMAKPIRVLICGIPNVGKSTLINTLLGKKSAKTGNEPGITRTEQALSLASDFTLYDTPGMLWPRINIEQSGLHLAASGAVGRNAYDEEEVALGLLGTLQKHYPTHLTGRYGVPDPGGMSDDALLTAIGRKRGAVMAGGQINLQKAAEVVLNDYRAAELGRETLETPAEFLAWQAQAVLDDAERAAHKAEMLALRRGKKPQRGAPRGADEDCED